MPICQVDWKDAFKLVISDRAEVLEYYEDIVKCAGGKEEFLPAVIRLFKFDKLPKRKVSYSRRAILDRDMYRCQYCLTRLTARSATIDHVVPRSHGGLTTFENIVTSCEYCNNKKGNRPLDQTHLRLNQRPFRPEKQSFVLRIGSPVDEWLYYLPRGMINELQTNS